MTRRQKIIGLLALCLLLICGVILFFRPAKKAAAPLLLEASSFAQLPGWHEDLHGQALAPLQKSCIKIAKKDPGAELGVGGFAGATGMWQGICHKLATTKIKDKAAARTFFENNFTPYKIWGGDSDEGLFTGYYEPLLRGSYTKRVPYVIPLYNRPKDLITVNLGDFKPDLKGETIMGRVEGDSLVPYYSRAEISKGALKNHHQEIVWVDNAVDAFFLHIQGSGQVLLPQGKVLRVSYAAQNGQPYMAIGKALLARGALDKGNVSMQSIRTWLEQHPDQAAEIMNLNASYVFFRALNNDDGPIGAEGVALTPRRSLAVDRKMIPYGVPVWLDADNPDGPDRLQRLMIAQDTGGAITGAVRGDFFWGAGPEATHKAGLMKSKGSAWILLPQMVIVPKNKLWQPWWQRIFSFRDRHD